MGLKIHEAQQMNLGKSVKGDQKETSGNRKSVFQMLGMIFMVMIYKSVCFVGGENVFWKLCTFSCCRCLVFCLLGSFPHPEAAPRLHIFLQVSQGTVNCPTRWSMHCPLGICINHIYFKTQISNEIKCSSVLVKSWIVDAQLEHRDRSRPPFLCDRCASLSQVGIFQSVHIWAFLLSMHLHYIFNIPFPQYHNELFSSSLLQMSLPPNIYSTAQQ